MIIKQTIISVRSVEEFEKVTKDNMHNGFYLCSITVTAWTKKDEFTKVATAFLLIFNKESQ